MWSPKTPLKLPGKKPPIKYDINNLQYLISRGARARSSGGGANVDDTNDDDEDDDNDNDEDEDIVYTSAVDYTNNSQQQVTSTSL